MSITRRTFLKSATRTTISAGLALGSAHLILGQDRRTDPTSERTIPARRLVQPDTTGYFPVPFEAHESDLFYFRSSTFTPYIGDIFEIPNARGKMITLRLAGVSDYRIKRATKLGPRQTDPTESFSLIFRATEQLPAFTSIHRVNHPALGSFDLFLTSRKTDGGDYNYEAVFSHVP